MSVESLIDALKPRPFEDRLVVEKRELDAARERLRVALESKWVKLLSAEARTLMADQYSAMARYSQILGERLRLSELARGITANEWYRFPPDVARPTSELALFAFKDARRERGYRVEEWAWGHVGEGPSCDLPFAWMVPMVPFYKGQDDA